MLTVSGSLLCQPPHVKIRALSIHCRRGKRAKATVESLDQAKDDRPVNRTPSVVLSFCLFSCRGLLKPVKLLHTCCLTVPDTAWMGCRYVHCSMCFVAKVLVQATTTLPETRCTSHASAVGDAAYCNRLVKPHKKNPRMMTQLPV